MIRPVVRCVTMGHLVGVVLSQHGHAMWTLALIRQLLPLTGPDYSLKLHTRLHFSVEISSPILLVVAVEQVHTYLEVHPT